MPLGWTGHRVWEGEEEVWGVGIWDGLRGGWVCRALGGEKRRGYRGGPGR